MKEVLSRNGVEFVEMNINSGMLPLKQFLKIRDEAPEFDAMRAAGRVGLPCLVIGKGEKVYHELPEDLSELAPEESGCGCGGG